MTAVLTIARFTALEALRSRFAWLVAGFVTVGWALAVFAGEVAIAEAQGFRSGLLGAWLRPCAVFAVGAFVISSALREFHDRGLELVLSMAVPRAAYHAGKLAGFAGVSALSAIACALALVGFAPPAQVLLWAASLGLELLIVTAASLLCVFTFSQFTSAMSAVVGLYLLSRSMTALQLMADAAPGVDASAAQRFMRAFVDALAFALPDLDRFTRSEWLIHGTGTSADLGFAVTQTFVYVLLLWAAALFDLYRKSL